VENLNYLTPLECREAARGESATSPDFVERLKAKLQRLGDGNQGGAKFSLTAGTVLASFNILGLTS
jgi:hypothetical protein